MRLQLRARRSALWSVLLVVGMGRGAGASPAEKSVTGTLTVDGKAITLIYAYVDEMDANEPIVVLSDKPLPAEAIPFIPEKMVKEKGVCAIAFSISRKDQKLSNTYGKIHCPGHELGVGLGRVEDGNLKLTIKRLDASKIEGSIATVKPMKLSYISYSFDLVFRVHR